MKVGIKNWRDALVSSEATIRDIIKNLDFSALQIAVVVDVNEVLLGTVTDGDVRRALLRGVSMDGCVKEIMYESPLVVTSEMSRELILNLMRVNKIHQFPIVDENRKVIGLHLWDEIVEPTVKENVVLIMAGGFGKRMRPYTEECPKPMLKVAGKPILEHIIERARAEGFKNFVVSVHYLGHLIEEYFSDGHNWNVHIEYLKEETPLGTAGALAMLHMEPSLPFVVTNGDVLTDIRYAEMLDFHSHHTAVATMAVRQHEWQHPFGVVRTEGINIVGFEEKPIHRSHVNAGIYVLNSSVLAYLKQGEPCDMPTLFERLKEAGLQTIAYPMHEPWLDIGRHEDLKRANNQSSAK